MGYQYPVYKPSLLGNEKKYVNECLDSTWISSKGRFIQEFEGKFADYLGVKHATTTSNGTVALHLALLALGIKPGDEVIVPTFTYVASVNTIAYIGAIPVFADSKADTWQLDPEDVLKKITPKTKAIMPVHLYGQPCDMKAICQIAQKHKLLIVEDCAEAFGSKVDNKYVGSFGDAAAFSFFGNKTITTGEGGMVITNDRAVYERAANLKSQGLAGGREYWHDVIGYNFRMTNIAAAIGLAQLERAGQLISQKRAIAGWYREFLAHAKVECPIEQESNVNTYWMYTILVESNARRDQLRKYLAEAGIETRPTFYCAHTMPMYASTAAHCPVAENISVRGMNLPSYPELTRDDIKSISHHIIEGLKKAG